MSLFLDRCNAQRSPVLPIQNQYMDNEMLTIVIAKTYTGTQSMFPALLT
jgi:hypothetical protein